MCLLGTLLLSSCGSQSKDSESDSTCKNTDISFQQALREQVSDSTYKKTDGTFQQSLREQVSDIKGENDLTAKQRKEFEKEQRKRYQTEQERVERERVERERVEQNDYSWMNGTWINRYVISDPYLGTVHMETRLTINTKNQTLIAKSLTDGTTYSGTYRINEARKTIGVKDVYFNFDPEKKRFYDDVGGKYYYYQKTASPSGE